MGDVDTAPDATARGREADAPRNSLIARFGADRPLKLDAGVSLSPFQIERPFQKRDRPRPLALAQLSDPSRQSPHFGIIRRLRLLRPSYRKTAAYGHFGRNNREFTWEKLDLVDTLHKAIKK